MTIFDIICTLVNLKMIVVYLAVVIKSSNVHLPIHIITGKVTGIHVESLQWPDGRLLN